MTVNPRICTVVNTAIISGILYKALPLGPRTQMAQVRLSPVEKQIAVGLGSAAAAYLVLGLVSRMVLWLQKSYRIPTSSRIASECPTVVELKNVGDSKIITSVSSTNDITRWIARANGHPIKIVITAISMGPWNINSSNQPILGCWDSPLVRVIDSKCKKLVRNANQYLLYRPQTNQQYLPDPLFPLVTACGPGDALPSATSFSDFLDILSSQASEVLKSGKKFRTRENGVGRTRGLTKVKKPVVVSTDVRRTIKNITHIGSSTYPSSFAMALTAVECGQDHYVCPSDKTKCVTMDKMCDGQQDCPQGEDEICTERCGDAGPHNKKEKFSGKIIGGIEAAKYSWPWQVFVYSENKAENTGGSCGGSIVAPQWILTAAHCCFTPGQSLWRPNLMKVRDASHVKPDFAAVAKIIPHPGFDYAYNSDLPTIHHDFCMLKLAQPLVYTDKVQPICLAQLPHPPPETSCYATGWGRTDANDLKSYSDKLREVDLRIKSDAECVAAARYEGIRAETHMSPEVFCTLTGSKSACHGDSGGPLACRLPKTDRFQWQLVGLTSFGDEKNCSKGPAFFARTRRGLTFMADVLYDEKYDGWNQNRTIRRFDPSVQYDRGDYVIDIPPRTEEPSYEVEGIRSNASWVADESCFPTSPPKPAAAPPAGATSSVLDTTKAPISASISICYYTNFQFAAILFCLSLAYSSHTVR